MKGKVAVFAREGMEDRLNRLAKEHPKIEIMPFTYHHTDQIFTLFERAFICDIYLFTEPLAYLYVKDKLKRKRIPFIKIHVDEYMIFRAFYELEVAKKQPLHRVSIDLPDKQPLEMVLKDMRESSPSLYVYNYIEDNDVTVEKIAAYHEDLWKRGKVDHVLTSSIDVKNKLSEAGIPTSTIELAYPNLDAAAKETESLITLNKNDNSLVVSGYVTVKEGHPADKDTIYVMKSILKEFTKKTDSALLETADQKFILFGTKALLDHIKESYGTFPLLSKMKSEVNVPINIAFGLGLKANQAQHHAEIALDRCETEDVSIAYVVNEREEVIGPLGVKKHIDTSKLYQALIHKARLNNELSYNFINFIKERNNEPFSSHDVAAFYNVTKRSAERTVNKLLSGEVIKVSGEERPYEKGRPRKLFTLNI